MHTQRTYSHVAIVLVEGDKIHGHIGGVGQLAVGCYRWESIRVLSWCLLLLSSCFPGRWLFGRLSGEL